MPAKQHESFHPRDMTAAGIAAGIERMESALVELRGEKAALAGARRGMLLSSPTADVLKHDGRIAGLQIDIERIEAQVEAMRPELGLALAREEIARIEPLRVEAAATTHACLLFWQEKYEALAGEIADGVKLTDAACTARAALTEAIRRANTDPAVIAVGGAAPSDLPEFPWHDAKEPWRRPSYTMICLPSVSEGPPFVWPDGFYLERVNRPRGAFGNL